MSVPTSAEPVPRVLSVQVGQPRTFAWLGRQLDTSIFKEPVRGPVRTCGDHLDGDRQADPLHHGGADKAVYAYAREDEQWWEAELGRTMEHGVFGENLTTAGVDLSTCFIGAEWTIGTAVLQVSEPRTPCWKLGLRMGDPGFPRRFAAGRRTGVLLRILRDGVLQAGDTITVGAPPTHGVTVADVNAIYYGDSRDPGPLYRATELAAHWRDWADHRTIWHLDDERKKGIRT